MTYTIYYRRNFYNQHRTYPRNFDRYMACRQVTGEGELAAAIAEITAAGFPITNIYNAAGRKVRV